MTTEPFPCTYLYRSGSINEKYSIKIENGPQQINHVKILDYNDDDYNINGLVVTVDGT